MNRRTAFTLIELMFTVALLGLLVTLAVASVTRARRAALRNECMHNMGFVEAAKDELALDKRLPDGYAPDWEEVSGYTRRGRILTCPGGSEYELEAIGEPCVCPVHGAFVPGGE